MLSLFSHTTYYAPPKIVVFLLLLCSFSHTKSQINLDSLLIETGVLYKNGHYEEMLELSAEGEKFVLAAPILDSLKLSQFRGQKANAFFRLDRFTEAIEAYEKAINSAPNSEEGKVIKGTVLSDRAFMEYNLQQELASYKTNKEAERLLSIVEEPDYDYLISIYTSLGKEATKFGYYDEGIYYLNKGMKLYEENAHKVFYLNPKTTITKPILFQYTFVYLYSYAKDEENMLHHLSLLAELRNTKELTPREELLYAVSLNFVADYYLGIAGDMYFGKLQRNNLQGFLRNADFYLKQALLHLDRDAFASNYLQFRFNQAKKHLYAGEFSKAKAVNNEILSAISENDGRRSFFIAQKALILLEMGKKAQMTATFIDMVEAIHIGETLIKSDFSNFEPSTNINHAGLLLQMADKLYDSFPQDSIILQQAANMYAITLQQFVNCYQGKGFNEKLKGYYEGAVGGVLKMKFLGFGDDSMLPHYLNEIENIENHFAWQEFSQNQQLNSFKLPDSLRFQEVRLRQKLVIARKQKDQLKILEFEDQLIKLEERIKSLFPRLFTFTYERFDYKILREDLNENTLILRYKKFQNQWYVFAISNEGLILAQLYDKNVLDSKIISYVKKLTSMDEDLKLGKWLLEKLIPISLESKKHLVIVPDDHLRQLPFETLVEEGGSYLIENIELSYAPHLIFSSSTLLNTTPQDQDGGIIIFAPTYEGNPSSEIATRQLAYKLKGAEKEAKYLAESFWGEYFLGKEASKENFIEYAHEAQVLHLSMHANIDQEIPELSYLLFSDKKDQGKMYVEELYAMNLGAKMAVLSACNTGKGLLNVKKGFTSIHQAFTFAGVPATVSSLWEVPDQTTQQVMTSFYQYLQEGLPKSTALQKAKIDYIQSCQDPNFNKPFFWAGFVLTGDISPLSMTSKSIVWIMFISVFTIGLMIVAYFAKSSNRFQ